MPNEQNEAVAKRGFEAFNTGDMSIADEIVADGAPSHDPAMPEELSGPDAMKKAVEIYRGAFPDLQLTIDECFSDGDLVCIRWSSEGTNDGELMGMPATGKRVTSEGISIDRIQDGKIVESWVHWDNLGLAQQLGMMEPAGAASA